MSGPERPAAPTLEGYGASSRIRTALPQMPEGMAKVGTLLLEDPSLPLRLSITDLAERAHTSPATVTRFCRAIGYTGYPALRVEQRPSRAARAPTRSGTPTSDAPSTPVTRRPR